MGVLEGERSTYTSVLHGAPDLSSIGLKPQDTTYYLDMHTV